MNSDALVQQIGRHRRSLLVIDTNLLLLYFVGALRPGTIRSFKRTSKYSEEDFRLLAGVVGEFQRVQTTPHIFTEVSNLLGQRSEPDRTLLLGKLAEAAQQWSEEYSPAKTLSNTPVFLRLGITDAAIASLRPGSCLVITDDDPLAGTLEKQNHHVIRFRELQAVCL